MKNILKLLVTLDNNWLDKKKMFEIFYLKFPQKNKILLKFSDFKKKNDKFLTFLFWKLSCLQRQFWSQIVANLVTLKMYGVIIIETSPSGLKAPKTEKSEWISWFFR